MMCADGGKQTSIITDEFDYQTPEGGRNKLASALRSMQIGQELSMATHLRTRANLARYSCHYNLFVRKVGEAVYTVEPTERRMLTYVIECGFNEALSRVWRWAKTHAARYYRIR